MSQAQKKMILAPLARIWHSGKSYPCSLKYSSEKNISTVHVLNKICTVTENILFFTEMFLQKIHVQWTQNCHVTCDTSLCLYVSATQTEIKNNPFMCPRGICFDSEKGPFSCIFCLQAWDYMLTLSARLPNPTPEDPGIFTDIPYLRVVPYFAERSEQPPTKLKLQSDMKGTLHMQIMAPKITLLSASLQDQAIFLNIAQFRIFH